MNLFENSKEIWGAELTICNESFGVIDIRRGIIQRDYLLPMLFVVVLIPFWIILNETDLGYVTS